ncbi:hypothetical protein D2V17_18470 [Aurantiacibacter xanthus]|uniref:Uncharacterized protein n=1 Tax=Aurantiacibacter xanthus TaxID=1784712 RepID=A0A3A1P4K3_9SPHN|nr:hypothetical protein [Aurantiacibacter xanthus]RIV80890.1 hypothetical protein D2V17_18470 [Aurantiacibacter xanthus]
MPDLELQLREDRMLRDAARALVLADIAHLKRELDPDSPPGPDMTSRARDLADDTRDYVAGHRCQLGTVIAALVAAIALWIFREPLAAMVREMFADDEESDDEAAHDSAEQADDTDRSPDEPEIPAETQA